MKPVYTNLVFCQEVNKGMNIQDIERREAEEDAADGLDFKNPLPVLKRGSAQYERWFELADEIDSDLIDAYRKANNVARNLTLSEMGSALKQYRDKYTEMVDIPILNLTSLEKRLNSKHLRALMSGANVKTSSDMPDVYKMGNLYVVSDGNHRVAASFINGEDSIKVRLLDMDKVWQDLNT